MTAEHKHVYLVSDSSGKTGHKITKAALSQFDTKNIDLRIFSLVKSDEAIERIVAEAKENGAIILFTLVEDASRNKMLSLTRAENVIVIDLLDEIIDKLSRHLGMKPKKISGLFDASLEID
jgi:regulator of PEP synthase PpsR (kinase-PPPase family)